MVENDSFIGCGKLHSKGYVLVSGFEGHDMERSFKELVQLAGGFMVLVASLVWVWEFCGPSRISCSCLMLVSAAFSFWFTL